MTLSYGKIIHRILFLIGIVVLVFFIRSLDFHTIILAISQIKMSALVLVVIVSLGLTLLNILFKAYRWKVLIASIAGTPISIGFSFTAILAGVAAGSILPGRVEVARPLVLKTKYNVPLPQSLSALMLERVLDLVALVLIMTLAIFVIPSSYFKGVTLIFSLAIILLGGTVLVALYPPFFRTVSHNLIRLLPISEQLKTKSKKVVDQVLLSFRVLRSRRALLSIGALSLVGNTFEIVRYSFIFYVLGLHIPIALLAFTFVASLLIGVVTAIPGGVGVTEFSASSILGELATATSQGLIKSAILLDRIISYYSIILAGSIILVVQNQFKAVLKSENVKKS